MVSNISFDSFCTHDTMSMILISFFEQGLDREGKFKQSKFSTNAFCFGEQLYIGDEGVKISQIWCKSINHKF